MSVFASVAVSVGSVEAANSKTVFQPIVWEPLKFNSKQINAPSTALLGAEKVVFSVVIWYAFGLAWASQSTAFDVEVIACCGMSS